MRARGHTVTSRVIQVAVQPAAGKAGKAMGLGPADVVALVERLRFVDGEPLAIERSYLNCRLCPGIEQWDLSGSLYGILRDRFSITIPRAQQSYEAVAAARREAGLLDVPEGAPLLFAERTAYAASGEVIEFGVAWYRGDRYRFCTVLTSPEAASSSGSNGAHAQTAPATSSAVLLK
jgi:GntR family transcriptional regulator